MRLQRYSAPAIADVTGDRHFDLISGGYAGSLDFYQGYAGIVWEELSEIRNAFSDIQTELISGIGGSTVAFADVTGDGRIDFVLGCFTGTLRLFKGMPDGSFEEQHGSNNPLEGIREAPLGEEAPDPVIADFGISAPTLADLTGDGFPDPILGGVRGNLRFFEGVLGGRFQERTGSSSPVYSISDRAIKPRILLLNLS
jgi:hypothetical protein